jgi:hypothetical protein
MAALVGQLFGLVVLAGLVELQLVLVFEQPVGTE